MKRNRTIAILMALALLAMLLPAQALAAEDYWLCPQCGRRVRTIVGDICPYCGYERHVHDWLPATCVTPKTCKICGETEGEPDPANHVGETAVRGAQAATCRAAGYTGDTYCQSCGRVLARGQAIPMSDHRWEAGAVLQEATCIAPGRQRFACADCGQAEERELPVDPTRHTGGTELKDERPATCGAAGYTGDTYCRDCRKAIATGRTIPATGLHDWQPATCTAPKTCKVCGMKEGEQAGHQWDGGQAIYPVTCRLPGVTVFTCTACGATKDRVDPADPSRHTWDSGKVIYPATCVRLGLIHYTCTGCGREKDETIPPDPENHVDTELRGAKEATCAEAGYSGDIYCKACGRKVSDGHTIPATGLHDWQAATCTAPKTCRVCGATEGMPAGHAWNQGEIVREATCITTGIIRYSCTVCGETKEEILPINPGHHTGGQETRNAVGAACEADGYTGDAYCTACGAKITEGSTIPATGHDWQAATTTAPKTCRVCGKTEGKPFLSAVTGLKSIEKTTTSISIGWDAMPGAEYYSVYQRKTGDNNWITKNGRVFGTDYTFTNLTANTEYDFRVIVHADGQQSNGMILKRVKTKSITVGDILTFGHYEQDNNKTNGPEAIAWQVLEIDEKNGKALLISKYGLDVKPYNEKRKKVTWAKCTLRSWLNKEFLETAFTNTEQAAILDTEVDNSQSQGYSERNRSGGDNTQDKIFLLSYEEAILYFNETLEATGQTASRIAPTAYAKAQGAYINDSIKTTNGTAAGWWWLRSLDSTQDYIAGMISFDFSMISYVNDDSGCVRPALWVNLKSGIF